MQIFNFEQGTPEWHQIRRSKPTASQFDRIVTAVKGDLSKSHQGLIDDLIAQAYVPDWPPIVETYWMKRGITMEPEARQAFKDELGLGDDELAQAGFVLHENQILGYSPDGLIIQDGQPVACLEIKCPAPNTHVSYVRSGGVPDDYKQQCHGALAVTGLDVLHFWSYYPGMRPHHHILNRDEYTEKLTKALLEFSDIWKASYKEVVPKLTLKEKSISS